MFDVNGILWSELDYARKVMYHNRSRLGIDLKIATRRIELFIMLEAVKGWKKEFEGLENLELYVDHNDKRDWGKYLEEIHRMRERSNRYATALLRDEDDGEGEGELTRRERQKMRKESAQAGKNDSNAMVVGDDDIEEQKKIQEKKRRELKRIETLSEFCSRLDAR